LLETIVISLESHYPNEQDWVVKLFEAGLSRYHLRKPFLTDEELEEYLSQIPEKWLRQVIPHQSHYMVEARDLGGWHFKDDAKNLQKAEALMKSRQKSLILSRTIHSLDDLNEDLSQWDYVMLGPVFHSISKGNYGPKWEEAQLTAALRYCKDAYRTRVYALGGVDESKSQRCERMGFDGLALLGCIWKTPNPLESFLKVKLAVEENFRS
tara:strand:+ start:2830 stop:3459 length:630 start_codon:yes stop_codon:yes gene_type:complete